MSNRLLIKYNDKIIKNTSQSEHFKLNTANKSLAHNIQFHAGLANDVTLKNIEVTTPPEKTAYKVGDEFDPEGMVVTASYQFGNSVINNIPIEIEDLVITPSPLTAGTTAVTISYTVNNITKTVTQEVNVFDVGETLNDTSWATISAIAQQGLGDSYWDVGDCKAVALNGTVGTLSLNQTLYVFILDFNHSINKTTPDNNIIFGGFKTAMSNGVDIAFCDSNYYSTKRDGTLYFNMNHWGGL